MKKLKIVYKKPIQEKFLHLYQKEIDELGLDAEIVPFSSFTKQDGDLIIPLGKDTAAEFIRMSDYDSFNDTIGYLFDYFGATVIPSHHPNDWYQEKGRSIYIKKVLHKASCLQRGYTAEAETLILDHSKKSIVNYMEDCLKSKAVCIDLETSTERDGIPNKVTAIGIAKDSNEGWCISEEQIGFELALNYLKKIVEHPDICKIGQNFINFDSQVLYHRHGMSLYGDVWDTLDAFKVLYPDLTKASLGAQGSIYLLTSAWKDEAWRAKGKELREYCAKDVVRTFKIAKAQKEDMQIQGSLGFFRRVIMPTLSPLARAIHKGINFDHTAREEQKAAFLESSSDIKDELVRLANPYLPPKEEVKRKRDQVNDIPLKVDGLTIPENFQKLTKVEILALLKPHFSEKDLKEVYLAKKTEQTKHGLKAGTVYRKAYKEEVTLKNREYNPSSSQQTLAVYKAMGIEVPTKRSSDGTWKPATGSLQLQQILFKYPKRDNVVEFTKKLQEFKPLAKFLTGYLNAEFPEDGRWRSQIRLVGTETTRAASKQYFGKYCGNAQNIPSRHKIISQYKKCFIPDEGYVMFNFDQCAAETWIQAYLAMDENMLRILHNGIDMHSETARLMFGHNKTDAELKKTDEREIIAKALNHSNAYNVGAFIMSTIMIGKGRNFGKEEVAHLQEMWHKAYPGIRDKFHRDVREVLEAGEPLKNPLGLSRHFTDEITDRNIKQGYAHIPQSTVPGVSNLMWQWVDKNYHDDDAIVLIQTHDSLTGQVKKELADEFRAKFMGAAKEIKLTINGQTFYIPWSGGFGVNYYEASKA